MVHNSGLPALSLHRADGHDSPFRLPKASDAPCGARPISFATMTGNADNLAAPSCKIGMGRADTVFPPAGALGPAFAAGARSHRSDHAPVLSIGHRLGGREQNLSTGRRSAPGRTTLQVSWEDGKVKVTCPQSLAPFARTVLDAKVVNQIRRHLASVTQDVPGIVSPNVVPAADRMCLVDITEEVDAASGRESSSISPTSTGSFPQTAPRSTSLLKPVPRNILKRRMSALTPPIPDEDPKKLSLYGKHSSEGPNVSEDQGSNDEGEESDNSPPPPPVQTSFRLDEVDVARRFLGERFCDLQQATCKVILKDWIKRIEPKKQSKFPYAASNPDRQSQRTKEKAPDTPTVPPWWPPDIRHKEPDHIAKDERRALFLHLVQLYKEDNFQDMIDPNVMQDVRKSGWINMLEDSTKLKTLQIDRENDQGVKLERRKKILHDIYDCARNLEEVWAGELDSDTQVSYQNPATLARRTGDRKNRNRIASKTTGENQTQGGSDVVSSGVGLEDDLQGSQSGWEISAKKGYDVTQPVAHFGMGRHSEYPGNELTTPDSATSVDMINSADATQEQHPLSGNFSIPFEMPSSILAPKAMKDLDHFSIALNTLQLPNNSDSVAPNSSVGLMGGANQAELPSNGSYMDQSNGVSMNFNSGKPVSAVQSPVLMDEIFRPGSASTNKMSNSAMRKQLRPLLPASGEQAASYPHQMTTYNSVNQYPLYSAHPSSISDDPQPMDVTPTDPPFDAKSETLHGDSGESCHSVHYNTLSADVPQHGFNFAPDASEYQVGSSIKQETFAAQDLASPSTLQTSQQFTMDTSSVASPSVFQSPISSATYSNFRFADHISIPYTSTSLSDTFPGSVTTFSGCSDNSFYSSSEMASPNSLYGGTSASSTMAQSPTSTTQAYPSKSVHGLSMNRQISSLGPFTDSAGTAQYKAHPNPAMRKFQAPVNMYSSDMTSSSTNAIGEDSMNKDSSPRSHATNHNALRTLSLDIPNSARSGDQKPPYIM